MTEKSALFVEQDFGAYGSRTSRNAPPRSGRERSPAESLTPSFCSRSSSLRMYGDDQLSPSDLSPGLLDLHSFDTELLPQVRPFIYLFIFSLPEKSENLI